MNIQPFNATAKNLPITVSTSASTSTALPASGNVVRIVNEGPGIVFISIGTGTQTATLPNATPNATSCPVLSGTDVAFSIPNDQIYNISAIARTSAVLNVLVGEGL